MARRRSHLSVYDRHLAALVAQAGFTDVQVLDGIDVFAGAPQHSNAAAYGTIGAGEFLGRGGAIGDRAPLDHHGLD